MIQILHKHIITIIISYDELNMPFYSSSQIHILSNTIWIYSDSLNTNGTMQQPMSTDFEYCHIWLDITLGEIHCNMKYKTNTHVLLER